MYNNTKHINLVLGGGGVKGIAYIGVFEASERYRYCVNNIAGVSAGALAGSFAGAGYKAEEIKKIIYDFDFTKVNFEKLEKSVPAIQEYMEFAIGMRASGEDSIYQFLGNDYILSDKNKKAKNNVRIDDLRSDSSEEDESRGNFLKGIITLSKKGSLFDGDYLEEWVSRTLAGKGIRTFGDLKGGIKDDQNPEGYKVRMTAVDANRSKILVLPDDIEYYGINPDRLEVAKAVRMSTCVPFAFKPVQLKKKKGNKISTYNIFDGGLLDGFPSWIMGNTGGCYNIGFKLDGGNKSKIFNFDTPLNILKALISAVHDTGVPKKKKLPDITGLIKTYDTPFLDFNISENNKKLLYNQGKLEAIRIFETLAHKRRFAGIRRIYFLNKNVYNKI